MKLPAIGWVGKQNRSRRGLALVCLSLAVAVTAFAGNAPRAEAQNFPGPWNNLTAGGILPLPPPPPQGAFCEVIFANTKWLVVQNEAGQQFPIAADSIGQFLVRWKADIRDLTPMVLVEAIGTDIGGMTMRTDHLDVFAGSAMTLVKPGYASVLPINKPVTAIDPTYQRWMNGFDIAAQNTIYSWVYPTFVGDHAIPGQMHLVGNPLMLNPLRLGVPGNNFVTVLPGNAAGMSVSQVTLGSPSFAKKGDTAFLTPVQGRSAVGEKSLILSQVVLYKKDRRDQFAP